MRVNTQLKWREYIKTNNSNKSNAYFIYILVSSNYIYKHKRTHFIHTSNPSLHKYTMDTTRLDELPVHNNSSASSIGQPAGNNIVIQQYDPNMMNMTAGPPQQQQQQSGMDQRTLQELVSGVQRASGAGMTGLPARDIPRDSLAMQHDEQVKPNYVPRHPDNFGGNSGSSVIGESDDYIKRYESTDDVQRNNRRNQNRADTLETLYTEFQMPILMGVMYFIFQMPALRVGIMQFLPSLFNKDGNMNLTGLVATSVGYATAYYIITKIISATNFS
jgi:hypothetical protein